MSSAVPLWIEHLRAASGDEDSLGRSLLREEPTRGLGPALALQAQRYGIEPRRSWRRELRSSVTNRLLLDAEADDATSTLKQAAVQAVVLKGLAVAPDYAALLPHSPDAALARPTSDIDLLVPRGQRQSARTALEQSGWRSLYGGPHAEQYLDEEGYAWQAASPSGALLELHHDLWNSVSPRLSDAALQDCQTTAGLLPRPNPAVRFVVAAVHGVLEARPRRTLDLLDLEAIRRTATSSLVSDVVTCCRATGLQLPVALATGLAALAFEEDAFAEIQRALRSECRGLERSLDACTPDDFSSRYMTMLRLLSGRGTRLGTRSLWRQLWPHPGIVERDTPDSLPWWRRRLRRQLRWTEGRP
ncbi:MAG: nucleotidyltransferase family protein [Acidobacteriota bacterium]